MKAVQLGGSNVMMLTSIIVGTLLSFSLFGVVVRVSHYCIVHGQHILRYTTGTGTET